MTAFIRRHRGISLVEVTIMLSVLSVLGSSLAPTIGEYVADARLVKARGDLQVLACSFARFAFDVSPDSGLGRGWGSAELLVGPGETPAASDHGDPSWIAPVDDLRVGKLEDHLMTNEPGYSRPSGQLALFAHGWRGAYLSGLTTDPWGFRYAINVRAFTAGHGNMVVLSAGANGVVESTFGEHALAPGGDDLYAVISGGR